MVAVASGRWTSAHARSKIELLAGLLREFCFRVDLISARLRELVFLYLESTTEVPYLGSRVGKLSHEVHALSGTQRCRRSGTLSDVRSLDELIALIQARRLDANPE